MGQKKKISLTGPQARAKIMRGVDHLADAVKLTLGPSGRNFASGIHGGPIQISNDGVSLAKEIQGKDEFEDIGVRAVREAATKTNDKVGDGTTTAIVLTQAFLKLPALEFDQDVVGQSSVEALMTLEKEATEVLQRLAEMAIPVTSREQLISVARVSVENSALAELVGGAQWDVGAGGTVLVEESNNPTDEVEFIFGVRIDNGLGTTRVANNQEKGALILENVDILITSKIFNTAQSIRDLNSLFESLIKQGSTKIVLIGRAFDDTAIGLCLKNIMMFEEGKGGFPIYPISAPYVNMDEIMEDLAAVTGATYFDDKSRSVISATTRDVGVASKVFCKRHEGIITGRKRGEDEAVDKRVDKRVEEIQEKLKGEISDFEKRGLNARLAQLTSGTAIVRVGAETEQERKYKKDKVDDAVNAVKAAMEEGVVPGAGLALAKIAADMGSDRDILMAGALLAPHQQIRKNAGGTIEVPEWVQDPLKVVRIAFEKAFSIAKSLATTEIIVTHEDEKPMWVQQANLAADDGEE